VPKRTIAVVILAVVLGACVTMTDPVPMGDGRYMITLNARGGFESDGELLTQSVQKANAFCAELGPGQSANVVGTNTGGVQMWTPQHNQVIFRCEVPK